MTSDLPLLTMVPCYLETLRCYCLSKTVKFQKGVTVGKNLEETTEPKRQTEDDLTSQLKLVLSVVLKLKKCLWRVLQTNISRRQQQEMFSEELEVLNRLEDSKKDYLPSFIASIDSGNLLVAKQALLLFVANFNIAFSKAVNKRADDTYGKKLFMVAARCGFESVQVKNCISYTNFFLCFPNMSPYKYNSYFRQAF